MAECLGVFILCSFGNGSVAQAQSFTGGLTNFLGINFTYGLAVTLAVHIVGKVSGGHINPAVTVAESVMGNFKWSEVPLYIIAQILGGFLSSTILWLLYIDMEKSEQNAGIFATYPRSGISMPQAILDEIFGTMLLVLCVKSITDSNNGKPPNGFEPLFIGATVFTIGSSFGVNTGYAINPARDLGPRIFTAIAGFPNTFSRGNDKFDYYFWIPVVGPFFGAVCGALIYKYTIGDHLSIESAKDESKDASPEEKAPLQSDIPIQDSVA